MNDNTCKSRRLWSILSKAIGCRNVLRVTRQSKCNSPINCCNRNDLRYKLFQLEPVKVDEDSGSGKLWLELTPYLFDNNYEDSNLSTILPSILIRIYTSLIDEENMSDTINHRTHLLNILSGFDNTGNVDLWPCEFMLAHSLFFLHLYPTLCEQLNYNFKQSSIQNICELGAGMSGLVGLTISSLNYSTIFHPLHILLTDGNDRCVNSLHTIVKIHRKRIAKQLNSLNHSLPLIEAKKLRWPRNFTKSCLDLDPSLLHHFDLVVASDCFFNEVYHDGLLHTIDQLLSTNLGSTFLGMAPLRNQTLSNFIKSARNMKSWSIVFQSPKEFLDPDYFRWLLNNNNNNHNDNNINTDFSIDELDQSVGHLIILSRNI